MFFRSIRFNFFIFSLMVFAYSNSAFSKIETSLNPPANNSVQQSTTINADTRSKSIAKGRVAVAPFTIDPSTGEKIMFISSAANPHASSYGYTCCFAGTTRNKRDTWEHNAANGLNDRTCYFFARMFDKKKELFFSLLYNYNKDIGHKTREKAHQIICEKLKNARFMQINEHSRLYFLYVPYENFEKELSAKLIFKQREQNFARFGCKIYISNDCQLRNSKYGHWIKSPRNTNNLELAFENDRVERSLSLRMSPYTKICWPNLPNIERFLEIPTA